MPYRINTMPSLKPVFLEKRPLNFLSLASVIAVKIKSQNFLTIRRILMGNLGFRWLKQTDFHLKLNHGKLITLGQFLKKMKNGLANRTSLL